jgi:hypothetical protein
MPETSDIKLQLAVMKVSQSFQKEGESLKDSLNIFQRS